MLDRKFILYRGDSQKIENFRFNKTDKSCLVGQGIYLTDNPDVADSYRLKNIPQRRRDWNLSYTDYMAEIVLTNQVYADKPTALKEALLTYAESRWREEFKTICRKYNWQDKTTTVDPKFQNYLEKECRSSFNALIEEGKISIKVNSTMSGRQFLIVWKRGAKVKPSQTGRVTVFEFPEKYLTNNVIRLGFPHYRDHPDPLLLELAYEQKFDAKALEFDSFEPYRYYRYIQGFSYADLDYRKLRLALEPFGIIGIEYPGGHHTRSDKKHRAFCIWDEVFVNQHKVT